MDRIFLIITIMFCLLTPFSKALAFEQFGKIWTGLNYQNFLTQDKKWVYLSHNQLRFINTSYPLQTILLEGSVGYSLNAKQRIWCGYYWSENDPYHHDFKYHRIWQQFYWKIVEDQETRVASRTRLEEGKFSREAQGLVFLRELLAKEFLKYRYGRFSPLIYDEIFFQLNRPLYASTSILPENRLFLGFNIYVSKDSFWKLGYVNQYLAGARNIRESMNHILTFTYTFGVPEISLPVDS